MYVSLLYNPKAKNKIKKIPLHFFYLKGFHITFSNIWPIPEVYIPLPWSRAGQVSTTKLSIVFLFRSLRIKWRWEAHFKLKKKTSFTFPLAAFKYLIKDVRADISLLRFGFSYFTQGMELYLREHRKWDEDISTSLNCH